MFIRYFVELPYPWQRVADAIGQNKMSWVEKLIDTSCQEEGRRISSVGFNLGNKRIQRDVKVETISPMVVGQSLFCPIKWYSSNHKELFPIMDGDIIVSPLGKDLTQLSINAQYTPPLAWVGKLADKALFHRIGEATLADFLEKTKCRSEEHTSELQ